jgi:hypothetical protein
VRHSLTYDETVYLNLASNPLESGVSTTGFMALGAAPRRVLRDSIVHSALPIFLVLPLWWAGHLFARATPQELALYRGEASSELWLSRHRLPDVAMTLAPIVGLRHQLEHSSNGGDAFLMGERSASGWWYYFPSRSSSRAHQPNVQLRRSCWWARPLP